MTSTKPHCYPVPSSCFAEGWRRAPTRQGFDEFPPASRRSDGISTEFPRESRGLDAGAIVAFRRGHACLVRERTASGD